jgi:hypothetical protein
MAGTLIVIPTYWTWPSHKADRPVEGIFDHPTPVDGESTLPRLLDSLSAMASSSPCGARGAGAFRIMVLTATVDADLDQAAESRVGQIIQAYKESLPIGQFVNQELAAVRERLVELGKRDTVAQLSLRSYPGVRNCGLILAAVLGVERLVALDDDEVVAPDYLQNALCYVGRDYEGHQVLAVAGPYADADGGTLMPQSPHTGNIFLDKNAIMNEGMRLAQGSPTRLRRAAFAFGGNLVLHRRLFMSVGFDPWITRGEDIDYLINAHLHGHTVWWDQELQVTHLPPQAHPPSTYRKLSQDVIRFVYEREKLARAGVNPARFDPYPGRFMRPDLEAHALTALESLAGTAEITDGGLPEDIMRQARSRAREAPSQYSAFAQRWACWMERLAQDQLLSECFRARFE